jgi:Polyketide cyclase / dehydrase and lipid transport
VHTRLAPGFVTDTRLEPGARLVTFINGMVIREPIVTIDDEARRLVWSAEGGYATHYNASLQVSARAEGGATVVWVADFLPDDVKPQLSRALEAGTRAMKRSLDALAR